MNLKGISIDLTMKALKNHAHADNYNFIQSVSIHMEQISIQKILRKRYETICQAYTTRIQEYLNSGHTQYVEFKTAKVISLSYDQFRQIPLKLLS